MTDIFTKWYRNCFSFCSKYACPGPHAIAPFFNYKFARLEYVDEDRFNLSYRIRRERVPAEEPGKDACFFHAGPRQCRFDRLSCVPHAFNLLLHVLICFVICMGLEYIWSDHAFGEASQPVSLSEVVLFGVRSVNELKALGNPESGQTCIRRYLAAISPKSGLWLNRPPTGPENVVAFKRKNLVEQIVTLLGENTRNEAMAFSHAVPLHAEWEGMRDGPVAEADFADRWLIRFSDTPIAPFLHLFKTHRYRAAYEAARFSGETKHCLSLEMQYRESLDAARSSTNPLISCIAIDLDAQTHVYLQVPETP